MPLTDDLQALVLSHGTELALRQWALAHGMRSLRHLGLMWVLRGETSLSEVLVNTPDG
jgi:type IV pilus assembly protein PilB